MWPGHIAIMKFNYSGSEHGARCFYFLPATWSTLVFASERREEEGGYVTR